MGVRRIIIWASAIAVIFTTLDLGVYFWRFAPDHLLTLSQDSEDWARFGEFVGGSLGPFFALLAFGAALLSWNESRTTLRVTQSDVLFKHALKALQDAYDLIAQTLDSHGDLDPGTGKLRNWEAAAHLLKSTQFLRAHLTEKTHQVIFDTVERPRYVRMFFLLLKLPVGFPAERYYSGGWPAHGTGRGATVNDYIDGPVLSIIYRFALDWVAVNESVEGEPPIKELTNALPRSPPGQSAYGLVDYVETLCRARGE